MSEEAGSGCQPERDGGECAFAASAAGPDVGRKSYALMWADLMAFGPRRRGKRGAGQLRLMPEGERRNRPVRMGYGGMGERVKGLGPVRERGRGWPGCCYWAE